MKRFLSLPAGRSLELGLRPVIMGIVNITPDSFFSASRRFDPKLSIAKAIRNGFREDRLTSAEREDG